MSGSFTSVKPVALTMGDVCGIGPEIICKAFIGGQADGSSAFVVGDVAVMRRAVAVVGGVGCGVDRGVDRGITVVLIDSPDDVADCPPRCLPVLQVDGLPPGLAGLEFGRVDARAGQAAALCIEAATRLAMDGLVSAVVTAPIHKEALAAAGVAFPGHTEMLQSLASRDGSFVPVRMMLANEQLRTVLVTIHMSLRLAIEAVTYDAVLETIRIAHRSAALWGQATPRIAVAGLNPHAGEGGLFGDEETRIIGPAIDTARREGIDASGPFAPDTVFMRARHASDHVGEFDMVIAMTHDHGLIPVKYLGVEEGVNVTLGLPFVRTSPDHGTAFDLAGTGKASAASLVAAMKMAVSLAGG